MLILSGGSDVTFSGGVDEVNRWQKGNILNDLLSAESWAGREGSCDRKKQSFLKLPSLALPSVLP